MKNAYSIALVLLTAALLGSGLRQFENANYFGASFAAVGLVAIAAVGVIRFRQWLDSRAVTAKD